MMYSTSNVNSPVQNLINGNEEGLNIEEFVESLLTEVGSELDSDEMCEKVDQLSVPQFPSISCPKAPDFLFNVPLQPEQVDETLCYSKHLCSVCKENFESKESLYIHIKINHASRLCNVCVMIFENVRVLTQHVSEQHTSYTLCPQCFEAVKTSHFSDHAAKHPEPNKKVQRSKINLPVGKIKCRVCFKIFSSHLKKHLKVAHDLSKNKSPQKFECMCCHHQFGNKFRLIQHIRFTHQNDRLVIRAHDREDNGPARFKCPHCTWFFKNSKVRAIHEIIFHETPPFKCICNEAYFTKAAFDEHYLKHTRLEEANMKYNKKRSKKSV